MRSTEKEKMTPDEQPELSLTLNPDQARSIAGSTVLIPELLKSLKLTLRSKDGSEIEIPLSEINFHTTHNTTIHQVAPQSGRPLKYMKCGNCQERIPMTGDQIEDHHNGQKHKQYCAGTWTKPGEYEKLIQEFQAQPNVMLQTELWRQAETMSLIDRELPVPVKKRWWKFWNR